MCIGSEEKRVGIESGGDTKIKEKQSKRNIQKILGRYGQKVKGRGCSILEVKGKYIFFTFSREEQSTMSNLIKRARKVMHGNVQS